MFKKLKGFRVLGITMVMMMAVSGCGAAGNTSTTEARTEAVTEATTEAAADTATGADAVEETDVSFGEQELEELPEDSHRYSSYIL